MEPVELARKIVTTLKSSGHLAYFVGGCVRDVLLGGEPKDYDVATTRARIRLLPCSPTPA